MKNYKLSGLADQDLDRILDYGIDTHGLEPALLYYEELILHLKKVANNPYLYPKVDHIREGYRRSVFKSQAIFYSIDDNETISAMRILGNQNPDENL